MHGHGRRTDVLGVEDRPWSTPGQQACGAVALCRCPCAVPKGRVGGFSAERRRGGSLTAGGTGCAVAVCRTSTGRQSRERGRPPKVGGSHESVAVWWDGSRASVADRRRRAAVTRAWPSVEGRRDGSHWGVSVGILRGRQWASRRFSPRRRATSVAAGRQSPVFPAERSRHERGESQRGRETRQSQWVSSGGLVIISVVVRCDVRVEIGGG